ncbi:MAG TPA: glutamate/aspartate ABC transporter substrate-binding protein [Paraburkholderia sp.]|nr:glutamate/aspartate ABC transporter substrate-binding protein [Paraburkholderia sp.]
MKQKVLLSALSAACLLCAGAAHAAGLPTLDKIKNSAVINLGVRESSIPFSYYDNNQNTIGYSQDIAMRIVDAIKAKYNLPNLTVRLIPITSQNRIPLVQNGTIDLECGSTTHTFARENQAAFSTNIFFYGIRFITKNNSGIKDFPDLAGKVVATTAGTSDERMLRMMNEKDHMNMEIISAKDHGESFLNVQTGRAVAFVMDEPLLYGERAKIKNPEDYAVRGTPPVTENYACMMRKDPEFKAFVDNVITTMETSGEALKLYTKWFTQPVPPNNMNLRYPLSQELKELFAHPNDKAFD